MKRKILAFLMGMILSLSIVGSSFAEFVYVTKAGKKFHHEQSKYSKYEGVEKITLEEAQERGLEPSKSYLKIKKEEATSDSESK